MTEKPITVFQDLHLRNQTDSATRSSILEQVHGSWRHETEREDDLKKCAGDDDVIVLMRSAFDDIDESALVLWQEPDGYKVSNIVPRNVGDLGIEMYNMILRDFVTQVAEPASRSGGFVIELSSPNQTLEDWLDAESATALRGFSRLANKSTGASHPQDRERWYAFLIGAHRASKRPDSEQLARWLVEVEAWSEERAQELANDYEFALGLLEQYEQSRS